MTSSSTASILLEVRFNDYLTGRSVSLALVADGKLQSPAELRAQIKRPLGYLPGIKRCRKEGPAPLGHLSVKFPPCEQVRLMLLCVAFACRRMSSAPGGMYVISRTTGRWARRIMERVAWVRVKKVQVWLQRRACCVLRCACRASACVRFVTVDTVFDACCRKRWLIFRCVAAHRSGCSKRAAAVILVRSLLLAPALQ